VRFAITVYLLIPLITLGGAIQLFLMGDVLLFRSLLIAFSISIGLYAVYFFRKPDPTLQPSSLKDSFVAALYGPPWVMATVCGIAYTAFAVGYWIASHLYPDHVSLISAAVVALGCLLVLPGLIYRRRYRYLLLVIAVWVFSLARLLILL